MALEQVVSFHKLGYIFFSVNTLDRVRDESPSVVGVHMTLDHSRYLELPSLICKNKRQTFSYLKDRLWSRLCS